MKKLKQRLSTRTPGREHPAGRVLLPGWILVCLTAAAVTLPAVGADNLRVTGALVSGACSLKTTDIMVDTGAVRNQFFYTVMPSRTAGTRFDIILLGCDLSVTSSVTVTFSGAEDAKLPGLLLPAGNPGVAFGIETLSGQLLPVNQPGRSFSLNGGETVLHLNAFIKAEPDAVARRSITTGPLEATTTFRVEYP